MKKKLTILLLLTAAYTVTFSQDLKPFRVGVGLGYAAPATTGAGADGGVLFYIEPGYRPCDNVLIGLRLEGAVMARGVEGVNKDDVKGDATTNFSYTINGQNYFTDNYVRPFIGAGVGLFSLAAAKFNTSNADNSIIADDASAETRFGFYPRIGMGTFLPLQEKKKSHSRIV